MQFFPLSHTLFYLFKEPNAFTKPIKYPPLKPRIKIIEKPTTIDSSNLYPAAIKEERRYLIQGISHRQWIECKECFMKNGQSRLWSFFHYAFVSPVGVESRPDKTWIRWNSRNWAGQWSNAAGKRRTERSYVLTALWITKLMLARCVRHGAVRDAFILGRVDRITTVTVVKSAAWLRVGTYANDENQGIARCIAGRTVSIGQPLLPTRERNGERARLTCALDTDDWIKLIGQANYF